MPIKAGEIYTQRLNLRKAEYARPLLVLRVNATEADICCFSRSFPLKKPADLTIHALDSSFRATGLSEESYLVADSVHGEPIEFFKGAALIGTVTNEIKRQIEDWWGAPLA